MVPSNSSGGLAVLRAVSYRIGSSPPSQLPHVVSSVAQSLWSCKLILSQTTSTRQKDSEAGVALHRFNTQISTLLHARSTEERWAAIVLIKATVEAGGYETLSKSSPWVQGLLGILKRPEPATIRSLCALTLTKIFVLTWNFPTLIREITTPALPAFITTCMNNLESKSCSQNELLMVLESFAKLVPRHPTVFRAHLDRIRKVLDGLGPNSNSENLVIPNVKPVAARLSVLLHQCEPRQGASETWERSLATALTKAHSITDKIFSGIDEDWQPASGAIRTKDTFASQTAHSRETAQAGIYASSEQLIETVGLLTSYLTTQTSVSVTTPIGTMVDLLARLFSVASSLDASRSSIRFSSEVSREEKETLALNLPGIHVAAIQLLLAVLARFEGAILSCMQTFLDQITWVFDAESADPTVRTATYIALQRILLQSGHTMSKASTKSIHRIIKSCCNDLLPNPSDNVTHDTNGQQPTGSKSHGGVVANADSFLKKATDVTTLESPFPGLGIAAQDLLPVLLSRLPAENLPSELRAQIDRTAVLTRHKNALVASVLNPPAKGAAASKASSLFPLLARHFPHDSEVEALLRPRMPVLQTGRRATEAEVIAEEQDQDQDEDDDMDAEAPSDSLTDTPARTTGDQDVFYTPMPPPTTTRRENPTEWMARGTPSASTQQSNEDRKRTLELQYTDADTVSKRQRASPLAQPMLSSKEEGVSATLIASGEVPRPVVLESQRQESGPTVAMLPAEKPVAGSSSAAQAQAMAEESDDDDFVIPTLDLSYSSDEEDEEDEKMEG